jgi:DNA-binding response OmpR family regulator
MDMHFPIVPIEQVPVSAFSVGVGADRPVVLVVEDDAAVADALIEILNEGGYAAIAASSGSDAVETALLMPPDLVITDANLPDMSGIDVAAVFKSKLPEVKIVLLDGDEAASGLVFAVVERPVQPAVLLAKVSASLESRRADSAVTVS